MLTQLLSTKFSNQQNADFLNYMENQKKNNL